jgi:transposase
VITIGIDPHKRSVTAVALDAHSQPLGSLRVAMTSRAVVQLLAWAVPWSARRWAVEGATGLGHTVAQQLVDAGELAVDVPAKLAAQARLLGAGSARKTDRTDAASVAAVRWLIAACVRSPPRTTRWRCGCSPTAATTWSPSAPAR